MAEFRQEKNMNWFLKALVFQGNVLHLQCK